MPHYSYTRHGEDGRSPYEMGCTCRLCEVDRQERGRTFSPTAAMQERVRIVAGLSEANIILAVQSAIMGVPGWRIDAAVKDTNVAIAHDIAKAALRALADWLEKHDAKAT